MYSTSVTFSRLLADLISASVGIWGVFSLLSKQHKLRGGTRVFRWTVVALGIVLFELWQHGHLPWLMGLFGLVFAGFFLLFPDISYYCGMGYQSLRGRRSNASEIGIRKGPDG